LVNQTSGKVNWTICWHSRD